MGRRAAWCLGLWLLACGPALADDVAAPVGAVEVGDGLVLGPAIHWGGLSVFPVTDPAAVPADEATRPLHLSEALREGTVRITETASGGAVPRLLVHNLGTRSVLVLAGEVVQGGNQDRIIAQDLLLPPTERPVPVAVNCVEHGRWSAVRGSAFRYGGRAEPTLRRVVHVAHDQDATWRAVSVVNGAKQAYLGAHGVNAPELAPATGTYMASLSSAEVGRQADKVAREIGERLRKVDHAVGVVVAYEGRVVASELYGDPSLFAAVSAPTLQAVALDALSTGALDGAARPSVTVAAAFLQDTLDAREDGRREVRGTGTIGYAVHDDAGALVHLAAYGR